VDRIGSCNTLSLKHRVLGNDGFIVLGDLGGKGIRSTTDDGKCNKTCTDSNGYGSTSRDTSNQCKIEWTDVVGVTRSISAILGPVDITEGFRTVVRRVTRSLYKSTTSGSIAICQNTDGLVRTSNIIVITATSGQTSIVGTNIVIVTEELLCVFTSLDRIARIKSTNTAIITRHVLAPVASVDSPRIEETSVESTQVSIVTLTCVNTSRVDGWARARRNANLAYCVVGVSRASSTSIGWVVKNFVASGLVCVVTVACRPGSPLLNTRSWAQRNLSSTARGVLDVTISMRARSSSVQSGLGNSVG